MQLNDPEATKPFKIKREILTELKEIEKYIKSKNNLRGWVCSTHIEKPNIIRLLTKLGGKPFRVDLLSNFIWFLKEIN